MYNLHTFLHEFLIILINHVNYLLIHLIFLSLSHLLNVNCYLGLFSSATLDQLKKISKLNIEYFQYSHKDIIFKT